MTTGIGVYWSPGHNRPTDLDYIRKLKPPVVRILEPDVQQMSDAYQEAPNAIIMPRLWWLDDGSGEQKKQANSDPIGTADRHAHQWINQLEVWEAEANERHIPWPTNIVVTGVNEPNDGLTVEAQVSYTVEFLDQCKRLGMRAAALCLGVGWPANTGPDTPVNWEPYEPVLDAIKRGNHILNLHEYWYDDPTNGWTWLAGRHVQLPAHWDVGIIIGECGVDRNVDLDRWHNEGGQRGWRGNIGAEEYAVDLVWYADACDPRVIAVLPFATDYRSDDWRSFDTQEAHNHILALADNEPYKPPPDNGGGEPDLEAIAAAVQETANSLAAAVRSNSRAQKLLGGGGYVEDFNRVSPCGEEWHT